MSIIEVNHLTKEYQLGHITSIKESALNMARRLTFQKVKRRERFKALDDINFSLEEGEVLGIIGHNGAGKSTLLKHLASITKPTKGNVIINGSVAPLIEVGAGVNPELTGRENIFLNGAILGIPKKVIKQKLDEIIAFSELEKFIDTPVKRYSSGMTVKLGFSIATSMDADILIVDEVLAVGDLAFQRKCFDRMEELIKRSGKTVLLVSHNIRQIQRLCSRTIMLDHGKIVADGDSNDVCSQFYEYSNNKIFDATVKQTQHSEISASGEVDVESIDILDENNKVTTEIKSQAPLNIRVSLKFNAPVKKPEIVVGTHTTDFVYLTACSTAVYENRPDFSTGLHTINCIMPSYPISPGVYCIRIAIFDQNRRTIYAGETLKIFTVMPKSNEMKEAPMRILDLPSSWILDNNTFDSNASNETK